MRVIVTVAALLAALNQKPAPPVQFQFTETEVNSWVSTQLKARRYMGVEKAAFKFFDGNYVSTYSTVDFDQVQRWQSHIIPSAAKLFLNGKRDLWVDFRFRSEGGQIALQVEKAYIDSVRVPNPVANGLMQMVAAAAGEPDPTSLFPMPLPLAKIWTEGHELRGGN